MAIQIEDYINEKLSGEAQATALAFVEFLRNNFIEFYKDPGDYWKDKVYYWLKFQGECIAFIAVKNPDEPENLWTVWSGDSRAYEPDIDDSEIKDIAWSHIDFCRNCGSCEGGRKKTVFGKTFRGVCGCTFRIDNPKTNDLSFLKKMISICEVRHAF